MGNELIGTTLNNRYLIQEKIGVGGMAEVFRGQDTVLGRIVAIKVMLSQFASDSSFAARFKQEAAAAANLQNPHIVNIYDWGYDCNSYFIVMEYIPGSDLKNAINERGAINPRKVAEIASQVCSALSTAHRQDIIHRDIKPQNIIIQPDGNVKVMDFGIAHAKNSTMDQTGAVLGTAHYISPEQAQGKELTYASDIYSLGLVMYEAITGKLAFEGPDAVSIAMKQVSENPVAPSLMVPGIHPSLEAIIMNCLHKNPSQRFITALDMQIALKDYLAGRPVRIGGGIRDTGNNATTVMDKIPASKTSYDHTTVMNPVLSNATLNQADDNGSTYKSVDINNKKPSRKKGIIFAIIAILLVGGVAGAFALGLFSGGTAAITVPDLSKLTPTQATSKLEELGLVAGEQVKVASDAVDANHVVSTDPKSGTKVTAGTTVKLNVSSGAETTIVPNIEGLTVDEAIEALDKAGLKSEANTARASDTIAANSVIDQKPKSGDKVAIGSVVKYTPSLGKENIAVPNVVGKTQSEAENSIVNAGFQVKADSQYSDTVPAGTVISQSPEGDTSLEKGMTVIITVSDGKAPIETYTVEASVSGKGGNVSPGTMSVESGKSVTFTVIPDAGYKVAAVNGTNGKVYKVSENNTFTVDSVTENITITVTFSKKEPTPQPANN